MKTLYVGYINKNRQKNLGYKEKSKTHYNQNSYEMECLDCGHRYLANGCDVWLRKCPVCQSMTPKNLNNSSIMFSRKISSKLRYQVLKRDHFKCCACGASPAKDPSVDLHIDHIIPFSKGGMTTIDNLQTLCSKCNLGKSNLL